MPVICRLPISSGGGVRAYLFNFGESNAITGGWSAVREITSSSNGSSWTGGKMELKMREQDMYLTLGASSSYSSAAIRSVRMIDLTKWNKLCVEYGNVISTFTTSNVAGNNQKGFLRVNNVDNGEFVYDVSASTEIFDSSRGLQKEKIKILDISFLTGYYCVFPIAIWGVSNYGQTAMSVEIKRIWLE